MSSRLPPAKRLRRSPTRSSSTNRGGRSSSTSKQRPRDANQLTITSLLLGGGARKPPAPRAGGRIGPGTRTVAASSSSTSKRSAESKRSEEAIVDLAKDDTPPPAPSLKMATGEPGAESGERLRDSSPELFSDPAAVGEGVESENDIMADGECSRVERDGGCDIDKEKGEDPGNKDVIEIDDSDGGDDESSAASLVREKSPISVASSSRSNTRSPDRDIDLPPWDGTPLSEIRFGPSTYPILPPLQSSATHAVLFRPRLKPGQPPTPFPEKFKDVWDSNHVRMPCSSQSVYPVATNASSASASSAGSSAAKTLVSRWDIIKESLRKPIANSYDLEEAILTYNTHYARRWNFYGLHSYFSDHCSEEESRSFFGSVLPRVIDLALSLPSLVTHALPLLEKQLDYSVSLSQQQVACLLANAFLCTFPRRNARGFTSEYANYPSINFNTLFSGSAKVGVSPVAANKLTCIFHYFTRVTKSMPEGVVTYHRQVLATPPQWERSLSLLSSLHVDSEGTIEDQGHGMLQVDFANRYLGGGVLGEGCVQEEIRFLVCPELILSRLFTEELDDNECLVMTGAQQFSNYRGYASSFEWASHHDDETTRDRWGRRSTQIVAIDALVFRSMMSQLRPGTLRRELNKAHCGYMTSDLHPTPSGQNMAVATGNWGCGAFGGNPRLKSLLQVLAASQAGRDVVYFTFGDRGLQNDLCTLHRQLVQHKITVGQVWKTLVQYHTVFKSQSVATRSHTHLYDYIARTLNLSSGDQSHDQSCDHTRRDAETIEYSIDT